MSRSPTTASLATDGLFEGGISLESAEPDGRCELDRADEWVTRTVRAGMASTIPFQISHLAIILFRLPEAAPAVAPILLSDLALTGLVIWWTWTGSFALNWRGVTFVWCCALILSAGAISVITLQSAPFYLALIMMVFGTAALAPWGVRWEASFILICLGAAVAVADGTRNRPDSFQLYSLVELGAASALAIFVAALNQRYRDAMTSSMSALQANESQLWKVFDANPDAITIARLEDGQYLNVSAEFLATGYSREEALNGSDARLELWVDDAQRRDFWAKIRARGFAHNVQAAIRLKSGRAITCLVSGVAVDLSSGPCVVTVLRNIDELKRSEQAMLAAREAAEAASRAKSEFLSSMSHEIRTPMNAILGMAEVLAESSLTDEQHKYLRIMINNGGSLLDLINDILDFARVESGRLKLERTSFDASEVVERVAETLSIRAHQKKLELVVDIAPDTPATVIGDPLRLRQVLVNLIGNAIKFTEEGEIELKVAPEDDSGTLHFKVSDTGIGIPADQLEEIFKGYTQAETSTARKFGGTGLGLAIVKQLTDLMGGRIWVESEVGRGTTFHFLTRFNLHAEHSRTIEAAPPLHGVKMLVVDDSAANRNALARLLAHQGAMVMTVGSGPEAIAWMRELENRDSVILLDCRMTPTDGYETARRMQAAGLDTTKVIPMVTADDLNLKLPLLRKLGFLRHLIKPVRRAELTAAIQSVAGPAGSTEPVAASAAAIAKAAVPAAPARSAIATPLKGVAAASSLGRPMRVLVADDSEDNRLLIDAFLKKTGYAVDHADNGEVAVQKFLENRYDVVLMDIQMPVMDGYQAVRQIRDWEVAQGAARTPVIALTASVLDEAVGKSFEAGCDTHVSKPVRRNTLLTAIQEVVTTPGDDSAAAG